MVGGLALRNFIRTSTSTGVGFLHAVGKWKSMGLDYNFGEFADAFYEETVWQVKRSAFAALPLGSMPTRGVFVERPLKQFTKYHGFGFVNVWDRATGTMTKVPVHIRFDRMRTKEELNQLLIEGEEELEREDKYEFPMGRLITSARIAYVEHNRGEAY